MKNQFWCRVTIALLCLISVTTLVACKTVSKEEAAAIGLEQAEKYKSIIDEIEEGETPIQSEQVEDDSIPDNSQSANAEKGLMGYELSTLETAMRGVFVEEGSLYFPIYMMDEGEKLETSRIPVLENGNRMVCSSPIEWSISIMPVFYDSNSGTDIDWDSEKHLNTSILAERVETTTEWVSNFSVYIDLPDDMVISNIDLYYVYGEPTSSSAGSGKYKGFVFIDEECFGKQ